MKRGQPTSALAEGLRLLSRRPLTEARLRQRLARAFPEEEVASAVERLKALGYLDDRRFAQMWSQARLEHRPRSRWLVERELVAQGVPPQVAQEVAQGVNDPALARQCAQQWAPRLQGLPRATFLRRLYSYLRRRGFGPSLARQVALDAWHYAQKEGPNGKVG
ncbi:MAG: regulatory protein RecX [Dehalococcoidia bacterium]